MNHEIVSLAVNALDESGINIYVACTRGTITQDQFLQDRCDAANNDLDVDIFVSVHHEGNQAVYDTRTYYANPSGSTPTTAWRYKPAQALADGIAGWSGYGKQTKVILKERTRQGLKALGYIQ